MYPENLKSKATLWLWELRDIGIIGIGAIIAIFAFSKTGFMPPLLAVAVYAFLSIRHEDTSIRDFIFYAMEYFFIRPQYYEWRLH